MSSMHDPLKDVDPWEHVKERKEQQKAELSGLKKLFLDFDFSKLEAALMPKTRYSPPIPEREKYVLESGQVLTNVHPSTECEDQDCAIHHPSEHALSDKPRAWQNGMIYRVCEHGLTHPDFDSLANRLETSGWLYAEHQCCEAKCCGIPEVVEISWTEKFSRD